MSNPGGTNQFQGFPETTPYGDKARQGMLQRLAPLAGTKAADGARVAPASGEPAPMPMPMLAAPAASPIQPPPSELYAAIAAIPGASDTVREIFGG